MATLKPGDTLKDRYRIRRFISRGGMGSIYLADDLRLDGRLCAIKEVLLDSSLPGDTKRQTREQFQREAIVLARLDHPNLPKVSDIFSEGQSDFLVMDYVPGKDLRTLIMGDADMQCPDLPPQPRPADFAPGHKTQQSEADTQ
jgi:serine/threonine protein kinase